MISRNKLNELCLRGFIVGPKEKEGHFRKRSSLPTQDNPSLKKPLDQIHKQFGMRPDWVKVQFTKKGLYPWEGGYFETGRKSRLVLHPSLEKKEKRMGYHAQEIIAHELVHAMREAFNEPVFEEVISYQTSKSRLRRFLGPLFRNSSETLVPLLFSLISFGLAFFSPVVLIGLSFFLVFLFVRRIRTDFLWRNCMKKAEIIVGEKMKLAFLLFLTDEEIKNFSSWDIDEVIDYLQCEKSLRFEQLRSFFDIEFKMYTKREK